MQAVRSAAGAGGGGHHGGKENKVKFMWAAGGGDSCKGDMALGKVSQAAQKPHSTGAPGCRGLAVPMHVHQEAAGTPGLRCGHSTSRRDKAARDNTCLNRQGRGSGPSPPASPAPPPGGRAVQPWGLGCVTCQAGRKPHSLGPGTGNAAPQCGLRGQPRPVMLRRSRLLPCAACLREAEATRVEAAGCQHSAPASPLPAPRRQPGQARGRGAIPDEQSQSGDDHPARGRGSHGSACLPVPPWNQRWPGDQRVTHPSRQGPRDQGAGRRCRPAASISLRAEVPSFKHDPPYPTCVVTPSPPRGPALA